MKVIEIKQFGAPDVLALSERAAPQPGPGEVLIKVAASGVNRPDVMQRSGNYPPPPGAPDLLGLEVAGEIVSGDVQHASNAFGLKLGDRVCALLQGGGYAEYAVAPIALCLPVPTGLSELEAATLPETFYTVWSNVFDRAMLGRGEGGSQETLLVQGGTSGIGITAIQVAKSLGHRVFATAGSDEKCRACEALGAEYAINYNSEDFVEVIKRRTDGRGIDVVLDMVGGDYVPRELQCLAYGGRIALISLLGGKRADVDLMDILLRRLTIVGSTLRPRTVDFKAMIAGQLKQRIWPLIEQKKIKPIIFRSFPAAQAANAHALMESSAHVGKLVLTW